MDHLVSITRSILPVALALIAFGCQVAPAQSGVVARWDIQGVVDSAAPLAASSPQAPSNPGESKLSNHLLPEVASDVFSARGWPAGAKDPARFLQFSLRAAVGYRIGYSDLAFRLHADDLGSCDWEVRGSHDGYATVLDAGTASVSPSGTMTTATIAALGTRADTVRLRLYLFNNVGGATPDRRGLMGAPGASPEIRGTLQATTAPVLVHWPLDGSINSANPYHASFTATGVDAGPIVRAPGLGSQIRTEVFSATGFPTGGFNASKYLEFTVIPEYGRGIDYSHLTFSIHASTVLFNFGAGWQLRSSADGFSSALASGFYSTSNNNSGITANISAVGFRSEPVSFRVYYYSNYGASEGARGFKRWFGSGPLNDTGPRVHGVVSVLDDSHPGTYDDVETRLAIGSGSAVPATTPLELGAGTALAVQHGSPAGSLALAGDVVVLASTLPTGTPFNAVFPGLWLELPTAVALIDTDAFGFPVVLPPQGLTWSFTYPGGLAGISALIQCHVISTNTNNGLLASTAGLELRFQ